MEEHKEIIDIWYKNYGEEINHHTLVYYLTMLFEDLRQRDLQKADLQSIGIHIINKISQKYNNEYLQMTSEIILANKISLIFNRVNKKVKKVKEKVILQESVNKVEDGDVYANTTSEPDIDLRGVDLGEIVDMEDEIKRELGIK